MFVAPLLAAGNDWIVGLATLIIPVVIWIFNRVIGQLNQPPQPGPDQRRGQRGVPPGVPRPDDEVQEFLRRVQERRKEAESVEVIRPQQSPAPPRQSTSQRKAQRGSRNRAAGQPAQKVSRPLVEPAPSAPAAPRRPLGSRIGEDVARDIDTSDVTEHLKTLTKLDQADEQMEAHVQSAFSHKLGQLERLEPDDKSDVFKDSEQSESPSLAAMLRNRLASPAGAREAVVMREVFDRPTHRW